MIDGMRRPEAELSADKLSRVSGQVSMWRNPRVMGHPAVALLDRV